MAFTKNLSALEVIVGEYICGHLVRWTEQFPLWRILILTSAASSFCATFLLFVKSIEGGYLGIVSFSIEFIADMLFARNILVHSIIGALIGWTLLASLAVAWKNLSQTMPQTSSLILCGNSRNTHLKRL